jgi:hypothetical protein
MAFLNDDVLDGALDVLIDATSKVLHICSQEPTTYTEASSTYTLGNKSSPTVGTKANGDVSGRKCTISAITDGSVTGTGTATHWALVDGTRLLATEALSSSQSVTSGNDFTLTAIDIEFPDPA